MFWGPPGRSTDIPDWARDVAAPLVARSDDVSNALRAAEAGKSLDEAQLTSLFSARDGAFRAICDHADAIRRDVNGDVVSYVVTRNINYTNVCTYKCGFCAFSKGKVAPELRSAPYIVDLDEVARRSEEAYARGATEVCLQGGIHPNYTGQTYLDILAAAKRGAPNIHVHAFSPLEVWHGAHSLKVSLREFLTELRARGLGSLPGTAAEILDDEVRAQICPDKINTAQWLEVMRSAHDVGLKTTSTIMYGHVEKTYHWARHLIRLRDLQRDTGGFTEFVPLPFVAEEAPIFRRGLTRTGPTFREAVLMHAVARIALHPHFKNIQTSWVKMGRTGAVYCLNAGVNDLGGTLMNETITRSAGAQHGQEFPPAELEALIEHAGRTPRLRTTLYADACYERRTAAFGAAPLEEVRQTPARRTREQAQ
ncbi:MAG: 5-amino-6-(D-ribitylamino)uracil--L-tyrosine 4-hydroxyphenyl transferase CofH [Caulobacterales bacterium]